MIRAFSADPSVIAFGSDYLKVISLNFIAVGIVFTSSSVFQGIGNTMPPLATSLTRLALFAVPATLLSRMPGFQITHVWYLSVVSVFVQACANLLLLRREFRSKLAFPEPEPMAKSAARLGGRMSAREAQASLRGPGNFYCAAGDATGTSVQR